MGEINCYTIYVERKKTQTNQMCLMRVSGKLQGTAEGPWTDSSCVAKLTVDIQEAKI